MEENSCLWNVCDDSFGTADDVVAVFVVADVGACDDDCESLATGSVRTMATKPTKKMTRKMIVKILEDPWSEFVA